MGTYQARAIEGASGVELVVALYDGMIRFMRDAMDAVERDDVSGRRMAVKRAMDIVIHLQATLRVDIGGKPAESLAEFYAAMFALMLQGSQVAGSSQAAAREKFEHVIHCVWDVREAWKQVADDPAAQAVPVLWQNAALPAEAPRETGAEFAVSSASSSWSA